jgi:hypothetical protein
MSDVIEIEKVNLKDFLANKEALKVVTLTFSNKEFEQAFRSMILEETGVDLTINITTEWKMPYIMIFVPEWERDTLSDNQRKALEDHAYSFDFPDEDFNYLLERFFKTDDKSVFIEGQRTEMKSESSFDIQVSLQLDYYESILSVLTSDRSAILKAACSQALSLLQGEKEFKEDLTIYGPGGMNVVRIQRIITLLNEALY